jgi:phenylacetate-CoA ligase
MFNLTKTLFVLKELISGREITKHYEEIKLFFGNNLSNSSKLEKLLVHAIENVDFYSTVKEKKLEQFPIVNKAVIRNNSKSFLANNFRNQKLIKMTTSGSTGTPFTIFQDQNKRNRNYGDTLYFGELAGYRLGYKLFYLKIWAKQKMAAPWMYKIQNTVPVDVISLDDNMIESIVKEMESSNKPFSISGYVSALEHFIWYAEKRNIKSIKANVASVITMSEGLSSEVKIKLEQVLGCPVASRYSNLENGIIAQQERESDLFLVNTSGYIIEIFHPQKDEILQDGELGRIVVTDLYNYGMPMIRYDTGDYGVKIQKNGRTYLSRVEGRKLDLLYDTQGKLVSSYIMYKNMWQYTEIFQYQLVQTDLKSYEFKINCPDGFEREEQIVAEFKTYLGQDADFKVIFVDEIPLLDSGKRRKTVNLYYT